MTDLAHRNFTPLPRYPRLVMDFFWNGHMGGPPLERCACGAVSDGDSVWTGDMEPGYYLTRLAFPDRDHHHDLGVWCHRCISVLIATLDNTGGNK